MSKYQKIAVLVFRILAVLAIFYSAVVAAGVLMITRSPNGLLMVLPQLFIGLILYFAAQPLSALVAHDLED